MTGYPENPPYKRAFNLWRERCNFWLHCERGRLSAMARELQVRRQTVWRWFNCHWAKFPGWAAVACNVYYYEHVSREADQHLREKQKLGPHLQPARLRSVSPQADKPRHFVPRSEDKVPDEEFEEAW